MQLSDMQGSLQGQLKLAVEVQCQVLRSLVRGLQATSPGGQPDLDGGQRAQAIRRLSDNRDDLIIMSMVPQDMGLEFLRFPQQPDRGRGAAHPLCKLEQLRLQDLEPHTLLVASKAQGRARRARSTKDKR